MGTRLIGICLWAVLAMISASTAASEPPSLGPRLPFSGFTVKETIPQSSEKKLPKQLPRFRYSKEKTVVSANLLEAVCGENKFEGTNFSELLSTHLNAPVKLVSEKGDYSLFADPPSGLFLVEAKAGAPGLKGPPAQYDSILNFIAMQRQIISFAKSAGIGTNDFEYDEHGAVLIKKTEDTTMQRGGQIKFIARRSVALSRSIAGFPEYVTRDRMELVLGANSRLLKFEMRWPVVIPVSTNKTFTVRELCNNIEKGYVFAESDNEYPQDGVTQIMVKDFRIFYWFPSPASESDFIVPIVSLHTVFKSKSGKTTDGGLLMQLAKE